MERIDLDYFARRAAEERKAAEQCPNPAAAQVHAELARRYAELMRDRLSGTA